MALPNVIIALGNGNTGRSAATADGVAGLLLTGSAVSGKLELGRHYQLSSTRDLTTLGITAENNPLADKEVKAFYAQAGDGAELHLMVVAAATTLTQMCAAEADSPLTSLIHAAGGRIRLVGVNKIAPAEYEATLTQGIDGDAVTAAAAAQQCLEALAAQIKPARLLMPAPAWNGETEELFRPASASYNRVGMVLASDDAATRTAAIGQVLGRAARNEPQVSIARVKDGSIAAEGYFTNGKSCLEMAGLADALHDAGYIFYRSFPTKNGCYLNDDCMAAPVTDDYRYLSDGRIIDKACTIAYSTYIEEIQDKVAVDEKGRLPEGLCRSFQSMMENAVAAQMTGQISDFEAYIDPEQDILSTGTLEVAATITPLGTLRQIEVNMAFINPAIANN